MKKGPVLFFLMILTLPVHGQNAFSIKEVNFTQVDDVVYTFVKGLKTQDLETILSVTAVNEMAEGFDFVKYCRRLNAVNLLVWKAPSTNPLYKQINKIDMAAALVRQVRILTYSLVTDQDLSGQTIPSKGDSFLEKMQKEVDPARLSDLTLVRSDFPRQSIEGTARYLKIAEDQALPFGAQDSTERLVLVETGGTTYVFGLHLLKYGDYWKIDILCSYLGMTSSTGKAEKIDKSKYESDISE